ncbi:MAG TPA: hypothetical protein DDY78_00105 [Planctomycetales bacterium]|jgi:hypothetical protein|nr:hypothetical protein [Planctomycetales bacterium]
MTSVARGPIVAGFLTLMLFMAVQAAEVEKVPPRFKTGPSYSASARVAHHEIKCHSRSEWPTAEQSWNVAR